MSFTRSLRLVAPLALVALGTVAWSRTQGFAPSKPSPEHQVLAKMAGTWEAETMLTMGVGGTMTSHGVETNELVCGGKWLRTDFHSDNMMGMPFEGHGFIGWDAKAKQYVGVWIDSMNESMTQMTGEMKDGKLVMSYEMTMMGSTNKVRDEQTIDGADKRTFVQYYVGDDGSLTEGMRIEYKRKSAGG